MRTVIRFGASVLLLPALGAAWWPHSAEDSAPIAIRPGVLVSDATTEQLAMARWAVGRFELAGLEPPPVEIEFHADPSGCGGHLGFAKQSRVDVCNALVNAMARRALLHEVSHIWLARNVDDATVARFLAFRGLSSWNSSNVPWNARGYEQGAEIMAWALGERILMPQIPDNDPTLMSEAFQLLTGRPLPQIEVLVG